MFHTLCVTCGKLGSSTVGPPPAIGLDFRGASEVRSFHMARPAGLEPAPTNSRTVTADVPTLLVIELDGGRVYLDDDVNLFALPAHAAIRDRFLAALDATGASSPW